MSASSIEEAIVQAIDECRPAIRIVLPRRMRQLSERSAEEKSSPSIAVRR
jgi:hypothetical protein